MYSKINEMRNKLKTINKINNNLIERQKSMKNVFNFDFVSNNDFINELKVCKISEKMIELNESQEYIETSGLDQIIDNKTNKRQFICNVCQKVFKVKCNYKRHQL